MMVRIRSLILVLVLTTAVVVPVAPARTAPATTLGNGFTVLPGSRLVGTTFPTPGSYHPFRASPSGWTAMLEVTGPATTVYDAYTAQARALDYDADWSNPACTGGLTLAPTDVRCYGGSSEADASVYFTLRVCSSCDVPVSAMTITVLPAAKLRRHSPLPAVPPPANPPLAVQLDPAQQAAARASLPGGLEDLGWSSIILGADEHALARTDFGGCARGEVVTIVSAQGGAAKVFERYVRVMPYEVPIRKTALEFHGHPARLAHSDFGTLHVVEVTKGRSLVMLTDCDD